MLARLPTAAAKLAAMHRAVVFDLGGVLVELGGVEEFGTLVGETREEEIWRLWLGSPWVRRYERGQCSRAEFAEGAVAEFGLSIAPEEFLARFLRWPKGLLPGADALVRSVRKDLHVACLSNTNELHWEEQIDGFGLRELFQSHFTSHELGLIKPDREIYEHVIEALDLEPSRIVFLDDNQLNVESARAAGIDAHRTIGVAQARAVLAARGLLAGAEGG